MNAQRSQCSKGLRLVNLVLTVALAVGAQAVWAKQENHSQTNIQASFPSVSEVSSYSLIPKEIRDLVEYEQTLVNRNLDPAVFTKITDKGNALDRKYYPEQRPVFELISLDIPEEELILRGSQDLPSQLRVVPGPEGKKLVRLLIHPESADLYASLIQKYPKSSQKFLATPLSSHRSLVVWTPGARDPPMLVKVSLNQRIGGVVRNLEQEWIDRAVGISSLIKTMNQEALRSHGIIFIDEPTAVIPKGVDAGFQIRSWPFEWSRGKKVIPLFSLYATRKSKSPLLVELIERSGLGAQEFIREKIIRPLISQATYLAFEHGLLGEPHAQNLLMELDANDHVTGHFWYRDFGGFGVDESLRKAIGMDMSFLPEALKGIKLGIRNDFVKDMDIYLRSGNLYALGEAVKAHYPEISQKWLKDEFQREMIEAIQARLGTPVKNFSDLTRAINGYARTATEAFSNKRCLAPGHEPISPLVSGSRMKSK